MARTTTQQVKTPKIYYYFAATVLISSFACLIHAYRNWPNTSEDQTSLWNFVKIPKTVGDVKQIGAVILRYKDNHTFLIYSVYFASYIVLQSLCIPGSLVLSILAGYLFPAPLALLIICTCSTLGASTFYILSQLILPFILDKIISSKRLSSFNSFVQVKLKQYNSNLFLLVFVLRATPVFPNWTINLFSPVIKLPFKPFVLGTFFGVAPLSVLHVWTGRVLNDLSNDQSLVNWQSILLTSLMAVSVAIFVYIKKIS